MAQNGHSYVPVLFCTLLSVAHTNVLAVTP